MPTYQYLCTECGGQIEAVQRFTDDPLTVHEDCGGKLRKVFSAVGIVFKGSGFYRTDSRADRKKSATANGSKSEASSGDSSSGDKSSGDKSSGDKSSGGKSSTSSSNGGKSKSDSAA